MNIITFKAAHSHYIKRGFRTSKRLIHLIAVLTIMIAALAVSSVRRGYAADTGTWHGEYFTIADPLIPGATPILVREDAKIDFDWGANSPDSSIPTDNFSVRWSRTLTLAAGSYRFTTDTDDGVRLKIDGVTVLDHFVAQAPTTWQADVTLAAGEHAIVMEYFEGSGDASARLAYSLLPATLPPNTWKGEYYATSNLDVSGALPALVRADPTIDFDWGAQGPADNFPANNFSVRWTRDLVVTAGTYRFATFTDDGLRLKVDGITVIDHFSPQSATSYVHDMPLAAGSHTIVMEYFEGYGDALAKLNWAKHAADLEHQRRSALHQRALNRVPLRHPGCQRQLRRAAALRRAVLQRPRRAALQRRDPGRAGAIEFRYLCPGWQGSADHTVIPGDCDERHADDCVQ